MTRICVLLLSLAVLHACSDGNGAVNPEAERLTPVRVVDTTLGPAAPAIRTSALVALKDETRLAFKVGGVIASIDVEEGQRVRAGEVLAKLQLAEVQSQVEQARQMVDKAERDLKRGERLYAEQVIALEQLQDLRTQREMAAQSLNAAEFNRGTAVLEAPADGVVLRKLAQASETVGPGAPVLVLGELTRGFVLKASLSDREVVQLKLDDRAEVELDAFPGHTLKASVSRLPAAADPRTGLFDIELALAPEPGVALNTGMVARVRIKPSSAAAGELVHVPIAAIVEATGDRAHVYVLGEGDVVSRKAVEVAFIDGEEVALRSGLEAGLRVVTDGAAYLEDGRRVRVRDGAAGGSD